MKLEIIKEENFGESTWYSVRANGVNLQFSKNLEEIEELYENIKANPDIIHSKKTVLKSEEI